MEQATVAETGSVQTPVMTELDKATIRARRTAFVARFIVLRESKRTRAHRVIELMAWDDLTSPEELAESFRKVFRENGDNMVPVERDLRRALAHSSRSLNHFVREYATRATRNFIDALFDYERSNTLLFGSDDQPKPGGWRLPKELLKQKAKDEAAKEKEN
jgi:hypothetical protein